MARYQLLIEYVGTNFKGWQIQKKGLTVQGLIQEKLTTLLKEKITLNGKEFSALHFNFSSSDPSLPDKKKLNTDIWYDEESFLWLKASFDKQGYWEYRLKNIE